MNPTTLVLVALGGALGSTVRVLIGHLLQTRFPWATFSVNVLGSLFIGFLMAKFLGSDIDASARAYAFLVPGFCGGFTTFSTFSWQTFEQLQRGAWGPAALNIVLSLLLCLAAVTVGFKLGRA